MAEIVIRGVSKTFAREGGAALPALADVTLEVADGDIVTIVGPSGCGKSTLLYIVAGLLVPGAGEVSVDGRRVEGPHRSRSIVFQEFKIFPWLRVLDNITFGMDLAREGGPEERRAVARRYMALFGLVGFEDAYPKALSGGMKQRVAIAQTLACRPDVLLLDEPLGSVDLLTRQIIQEELLQVFETERKTVVMVTHSIEEAIFLGQRVVVMSARPGTVREILSVPFAYPRTREAVEGSPEFSRLRARIRQVLRKEVLRGAAA